jgi:hypothetical protein
MGNIWFSLVYCAYFFWFVAKILVVNKYLFIFLIIFCQIINQVWVENFLANKLASQLSPTFDRARHGMNQTCPIYVLIIRKKFRSKLVLFFTSTSWSWTDTLSCFYRIIDKPNARFCYPSIGVPCCIRRTAPNHRQSHLATVRSPESKPRSNK